MSSEKLPPLYGKTERPGHGRPQRYVTPSTWQICTLIGELQKEIKELKEHVQTKSAEHPETVRQVD